MTAGSIFVPCGLVQSNGTGTPAHWNWLVRAAGGSVHLLFDPCRAAEPERTTRVGRGETRLTGKDARHRRSQLVIQGELCRGTRLEELVMARGICWWLG